MNRPLIDVLIPARGDCPWLADALESIARQTLLPDSVILVDDGLSRPGEADENGACLLAGRYRRITNRGSGIAAALNTGVDSSRATWIARMDADDVAHPQRLEKQYQWLATAGSDAVGCGCQVRLIDDRGRALGTSHYPLGWAEIKQQLLRHSCFAHPTMVLRRETIQAIPYRSALDGAEDVDLVLRLSEHGRLENLESALLDYRIHVSQQNFLDRARQTALQELAFRLAMARSATGEDPLAHDPGLAQRFVEWRTVQPGYAQARKALTAFRYLRHFLRGGNLAASSKCLRVLARSRPWQRDVLGWVKRIHSEGPGGFANDTCPFALLNPDAPEAVSSGASHA